MQKKSLNLDGVDLEKGATGHGWTCLAQYARFWMDEEGDFLVGSS